MKYDVKMQMSEAEFIALTVLAEKLLTRMSAARSPWLSGLAAPEPAPVPAPEPSAVDALAAAYAQANADADAAAREADAAEAEHDRRIKDGAAAWAPLMRTWAQNFEVADAPQPDRAGALMAVFVGYPLSVGAYIRERGGLAGACIDTLAREGIVTPDAAESIGKRIALNIVQVGSAIGLPTDGLIERSLVRRADPDTLPLHGGPLADTVDMTRPEFK
jgi:hypothetical protein